MTARRHLHLLIALLLPLMVVRGMLPAGYMPVVEHGEIRMSLCSDGLQPSAGSDDSGHPSLPGGEGDCLFAHAGMLAPPPVFLIAAASGLPSGLAVAPGSGQQSISVIPRAQSSRGPPARA